MSSLISELNPISNLLGYKSYAEWAYCVFEKSITIEEDETEDAYNTRIAYIAAGIDDQIEYLSSDKSKSAYTFTEKKVEIARLKKRINDYRTAVGFFPSYTEVPEISASNNLNVINEHIETKTTNQRTYVKSKLHQLLEHLLKENINLSINDIWTRFFDNQEEEFHDLIEIRLVTDKTGQNAKLYWLDSKTGFEGASITRKSLSSLMSKIRKELNKS